MRAMIWITISHIKARLTLAIRHPNTCAHFAAYESEMPGKRLRHEVEVVVHAIESDKIYHDWPIRLRR